VSRDKAPGHGIFHACKASPRPPIGVKLGLGHGADFEEDSLRVSKVP